MRRLFRLIAIGSPVVLTAGTIGTYLAVTTYSSKNIVHKKEKKIISKNHDVNILPKEDSYSKFKIFPDLDQHDFYNDIKINQLKAVIDQEMQAKIINYVFRHTSFTEGNISYSINKITPQNFKFHFKWISPDGYPHYKTYHFVIDDIYKK